MYNKDHTIIGLDIYSSSKQEQNFTPRQKTTDHAVIKDTLFEVYAALKEKGYNPTSQMIGYMLSEDPTYITTHNDARKKICRLDRDEMFKVIVSTFFNK